MKILLLCALITSVISTHAQVPDIPFNPPQYVCYRTHTAVQVDGKLAENVWNQVPWTSDFVDIEGNKKPKPRFRTRVKMLWDDAYLYVAAELEEPEVWATFTERESPLYEENNFEVFIDPSGDTHNYYELEINALGTVWDLLMNKPYRDGGLGISGWDIYGLKTAVHVNGTRNDPQTRDTGWTVEMALPWQILKECAPGKRIPQNGDQWRMTFSRAQWPVEVVNGKYTKKPNPQTGNSDFWTWAPQGVFAMHQPETWGIVQFSSRVAGSGTDAFILSPDEQVKWALRQLYYAQHEFRKKHGFFTNQLPQLTYTKVSLENYRFAPAIQCTDNLFEITAKSTDGKGIWRIQQDGRIWREGLAQGK
jgi:hypothetical protein